MMWSGPRRISALSNTTWLPLRTLTALTLMRVSPLLSRSKSTSRSSVVRSGVVS
ncbi:hypothetical protein GALL_458790 [mine drainage metagenome]|uniref:Uncharacterized protein n=1 Tax=mine drainage metagenome TaxID=410659 RepID=A0A1J5PNY3_9ZZZZ